MNIQELEKTARAMVAPGKGILAADESFGTIERRFKAVGIESTEENRRAYRGLLFTTQGIGEFLSGVIMFDETIRQSSSDGTSFVDVLHGHGVIPGIKVDKGAKDMALAPGEKVTDGLDGLRERLQEYREIGARFAKWRAVITIGDGIPSQRCIDANAEVLARYAALCQDEGLVPIIEPEVVRDGDHSAERSFEATEATLHSTFNALYEHRVDNRGVILKTNMITAGQNASQQASVQQVADLTVECLLRTVPATIPGIAFLSGGQSDKQATAHLNTMNATYKNVPWELGFSYARALQELPMKTWNGQAETVDAAQKAFYHRAKLNSAARSGSYKEEMEQETAAA